MGTCVTGLVNAIARGIAQIVASRGLTHIDFAFLRLFLGVEEWTTTQLAQALPLAPVEHKPLDDQTGGHGPGPEASPAQRPEGRHS